MEQNDFESFKNGITRLFKKYGLPKSIKHYTKEERERKIEKAKQILDGTLPEEDWKRLYEKLGDAIAKSEGKEK